MAPNTSDAKKSGYGSKDSLAPGALAKLPLPGNSDKLKEEMKKRDLIIPI